MKTLNIGIMNFEDFQQYTLDIVSGKRKRVKNEPKVWFNSVKAFAEVLCSENLALLSIIADKHPATIKELAEYSGRRHSNLSRTLHTLEKYNLIKLQKIKTTVKPVINVTKIRLNLDVCNFKQSKITANKLKCN